MTSGEGRQCSGRGPQWAAFVVHATGRRGRGRRLLNPFLESHRQRLDVLAMKKLALSVLVESSAIAIQC
jgi:hypothetical protein